MDPHLPLLEAPAVGDIEDALTRLYRNFQTAYLENPVEGKVSEVSHSHLICNGNHLERTVTLDEISLLNTPETRALRQFVLLLPTNAHFAIEHFPRTYDVFTIEWGNQAIFVPTFHQLESSFHPTVS